MNFTFSDEQAMIAETVGSFFRENATSERTRRAMDGDGIDRELWLALANELGMAGIAIPEEFGGADLGMVETAILAEAAGSQVSAIPLLGQVMVSAALKRGGNESQKSLYLPRLAAGELVCTICLADPALDAAAEKMSGTLQFVPHGSIADLLLVLSPNACSLVDLKQPGVRVSAHTTLDQTRPLATIELDEVRAEPLDSAACEAALAGGWICLAAEALGGAQEALDRTVAYSLDRVQFGRPIGSFQAYKHRLADMKVALEQARSAVYWAACAFDEGAEEARVAVHAAKSFCADTYVMITGNMIQLHGGIGFTWEHDAHLFFKRARSISTLLFNSDWHREQIASLVIGEAA